MSVLGDMVVRITANLNSFNSSIDQAESKFKQTSGKLKSIGNSLTAFVTLPIVGIGAVAIKSAADMEALEASFTTMLGSAEKAGTLMANLKKMGAETPFEVTQLAGASKTLLQFGIDGEKVIPILKQLGDVAGGNSEKLGSLALVFGQIQSTGKLMGQDLLQLINAGFNPLKEISRTTGESMTDLKDKMSRGAVTADMVTEAFRTATSEGGLFNNGMLIASKTLSGLASTMKDDLLTAGRSLVESLMPTLKDLVKAVSEVAQWFSSLDETTRKTIVTVALIVAAIGPLLVIIGNISGAIGYLISGGGPVALAIVGVAALAAIFVTLSNNMAKANKDLKDTRDIMKGGTTGDLGRDLVLVNSQIERVTDQINALKRSVGTRGVTTVDTSNLEKELAGLTQAKSTIIEMQRGQARNLQIQESLTTATEETSAVTKQYQEAWAKVIELTQPHKEEIAEIEAELKKLEAVKWLDPEQEAAKLEAIQLLKDKLQEFADEEVELTQEKTEKIINIDNILLAQKLKNFDESMAKAREEAEQYGKAVVKLGSLVKPIFEEMGAQIASGELSWKALGEVALYSIASIVSALGDELVASAAADTVKAVAALVSVVGAPLAPGLFASAAIKGAGAAAAYIASGAIKAVQLAEGGIVMPKIGGTLAQVAEAGQPEAVIPLDKLETLLSGIGNGIMHIVVNLDSQPFLDTIFPATRNRTILIDQGAIV